MSAAARQPREGPRQSFTVRVRDEHIGCHSWVEIDRDLPFEGVPVMADDEFDRAAAAIRTTCTESETELEPALA